MQRRGLPGAGPRVRPIVIVAVVALIAPAVARAHPRGPAIALDYRATVVPRPVAGVSASVLDGDRKLRLVAAPDVEVVVLGYLGEPTLRISPNGVAVNERSPTALADGIVRPSRHVRPPAGKPAWVAVGSGRSFAWHDHRIAPRLPADVRRAAWSIPIVVDGTPARLRGEIVRVRRPAVWPWIALGVGFLSIGAGVAAWRRPDVSLAAGIAVSAIAGAAGLASMTSFSLAGASGGPLEWLEVAAGSVLAAAGTAGLLLLKRRRRAIAGAIGALAAIEGLGRLGVFKHGVVISALPASGMRAADAVAIGAGLAATLIALAQPSRRYEPAGPRRR